MSAQLKPSPGAGAGAAPPTSALMSNPLFARYLRSLQANPLATKQLTSGIFAALAEVLAGHLAGLSPASAAAAAAAKDKDKDAATPTPTPANSVRSLPGVALAQDTLLRLGVNDRALKMFVYGWAVSAPMGHVLTGALQRAFAGRTTTKDKILQIIVNSLTVTVIQNIVYLSSMAVVNGARAPEKIIAVVKAGIWRMLQISWLTQPAALVFAQNYLPAETWEPFFTLLRFFLSTYFNTMAKKKQVALARRQALAKGGAGGAANDAGGEEINQRAEEANEKKK